MSKKILSNGYRSLLAGEKSPWKQFTSLDEFIWDGVYSIRLVHDDGSLALPFQFQENDIVNLVVKDQITESNLQNSRIIVQTLTQVDRLTGHVYTYTRTRRFSNGGHLWGQWVAIGGEESTGIVEQAATQANIQPNVLNVWGVVTELSITLLPPANTNVVNEYMIQFTSGETATTLILPADIKWMSTPTIQANKVYQISIVNNLAVMGEFSNE